MTQNTENQLLPVLEQIERDKGIKKEDLLLMIEGALVSAFRKHSGKFLNVEARINPETAQIEAFLVKKVVENVSNPQIEISPEDAKKIKPKAKIDEDIRIPVETNSFGRIAAQTAKQVIIQRIREVERENLYQEYSQKMGQILNGSVYRFINKNIIVDLGNTEAILPAREQVPRERFAIGDRIKVYALRVEKGARGPQIIVSRTHIDLIRRLFELEVPEVYDKTVEIQQIVREAGSRCKVAVISHNPKVDPIGSCVGVKGCRVRAIINELQGTRIDLVAYASDPEKYIASSLSPAKTLSVSLTEIETLPDRQAGASSHKEKRAKVLVADDQLSLAIGRGGQNVRLASRLTGWTLDIQSESQARERKKAQAEVKTEDLSQIPGVGPKLAEVLFKGGFETIERVAQASADALTALQGVGPKTAQKLIDAAKSVLSAPKEKEDDKKTGENEDKGKEET